MELFSQKKIAPYLKFLKILCVLSAVFFTGILLLKDLYFDGWEAKKETIIYSIPMVFLFFMWIKFRLDEENTFKFKLLGIDILAISLSAARIFGILWHSGHVLFILYTFLNTKNSNYRILCIPFFILTAGFKIFWLDFWTPFLGSIMAIILYKLRSKFEQKINPIK